MFLSCIDMDLRKRRISMQKRFCACGVAVWVSYLSKANWKALFFVKVQQKIKTVHKCPHCNQYMNIDSLR